MHIRLKIHVGMQIQLQIQITWKEFLLFVHSEVNKDQHGMLHKMVAIRRIEFAFGLHKYICHPNAALI